MGEGKDVNERVINKKKINPRLFWGVFLGLLMVAYLLSNLWGFLFHEGKEDYYHFIFNTFEKEELNKVTIKNYLEQTKEVGNGITAELHGFSDKERYDLMKESDIVKKLQIMDSYSEQIKTDIIYLKPLESFYERQIQLATDIIHLVKKHKEKESYINAFKMSQLRNDYNKHVRNEQIMIIELFKRADIYYEEETDKSLHYEIK